MTETHPVRGARRGFLCGFAVSSILWIALLATPIVMPQAVSRTLYSFLDISTPPRRADYLFVPAGSLFYRLPFAVNLLHQRLGDTLVLTVTEPSKWRREIRNYADEDMTEGSLVLKLLRSHGVGDTQVIFLGETRSTLQEAGLLTEFLSKRPASTATAVSDGYHLRRIRLSLTRSNPEVSRTVSYTASSTFDDLLQRDVEISDVYQQIFKEWIKLIFYAIGNT